MKRPVLLLQTVYFHESDQKEAQRLGNDLYDKLTRPIDDPLAHGPGIPVLAGVKAEAVETNAADTVVIIPVLGNLTGDLMKHKVVDTLKRWHSYLGAGHLLPVPLSANWRDNENELPGNKILAVLYAKEDAHRLTLDEIVLAVMQLWETQRRNINLFISHAKDDIAATDEAAKKIHSFVTIDTIGKSFFDTGDLRPSESLGEKLGEELSQSVLILVRTDAYSSREWCRLEALLAKQNGIPTLIVEIPQRRELLSSPYGGNDPIMVWDGNPSRVISQAMVEWLRAAFFCREAKRIIEITNLPKDVAIAIRQPGLHDISHGPLQSDCAQLFLHPDPELPAAVRRVLKAAHPRLHLVTPTTAFRSFLSHCDRSANVASPLNGMQVAMSLLATSDADTSAGFTHNHVVHATVCIARTLISAGATIAYGGDFRSGANAFVPLLVQLVLTYNPPAGENEQALHIYQAAIVSSDDLPPNLPIELHHLGKSPGVAVEALLPKPGLPDEPPSPLYFSDMYRVVEDHVSARVVLGGQTEPQIEANGDGYAGRYPGIVEQAWRSLQTRKPLYVAGGFGGAAGLVADLAEGKETPPKLQDATWMIHDFYAQNAAKFDAHLERKRLGLPERMDDLADAVRTLARALLKDDCTSTAWNGLTVAENETLFRTRDPVALTILISKGLLRVACRQG